jgi:hypothetical protein
MRAKLDDVTRLNEGGDTGLDNSSQHVQDSGDGEAIPCAGCAAILWELPCEPMYE